MQGYVFLKGAFLGIRNGLRAPRFLIRRFVSLSACCLSLLGMPSGSLHAHRAASSHSATQCPILHGSFWGMGKVLPAICGERGS